MLTTIFFLFQLFGLFVRRVNHPLNLVYSMVQSEKAMKNSEVIAHYYSLAGGEGGSINVLINEKETRYFFWKPISASQYSWEKMCSSEHQHVSLFRKAKYHCFIFNTWNFRLSCTVGPFTALGFHELTILLRSRSGLTLPPDTHTWVYWMLWCACGCKVWSIL